jgi:hypothetical protein
MHNSFFPRFTASDCGHMWMLINGDINYLCDETPIDLRMEYPALGINFACLSITIIETQRKATN